MAYKCDLNRMSDKIKTFSKFGDAGHGGITRYSLSPEAHMAREEFVKRMEAIGAKIECDDVACMYATIEGSDPNAKRIVLGSHVDSVKNGGNYDGILGVMTGMEVLETIVAENIPHKHPVTAMIWTNEEGSLYPPAMMVSGIICNDYIPKELAVNFQYENMMKSTPMDESEFANFGEALAATKFKGPKENRISPDKYCAMFEAHLEQGPILEEAGNEVGAVQLVMGMFNYRVRFHGFTAHAGTFPMGKRHDALFAASTFLCEMHKRFDELNKGQEPEFVYTTGEIYVHPCIHTCIPDEAEFSLDVRHPDPELRKKVMGILKDMAKEEWCKCTCEIEEQWVRDTVYFDKDLVRFVEESMEESGMKWQKILSGAGHDAQFCAYMLPTTMIFTRTKDGLSHCEPEFVSDEDCTAGATAALGAVLKADKFYE
ncbi:MAG: Zn-dependent hydrolase [Clostridiales bacterium]|nr:Zn-dependent hydrolase [Clostridiales bacterium]